VGTPDNSPYTVTVTVTDSLDSSDHDSATFVITVGPLPVSASIPATPLPDSPVIDPLVSVAKYRQVTSDTSTPADQIEDAIAEATELACQHCNRTFAYGHYTETLYVNRLAMSYPSAIPIAQVDGPLSARIQGAGVLMGWFPVVMIPFWTGVIPPQAALTYWGGYTADTIPPRLARAIAKIAWFTLHPVTLEGLAGGATSASVSGVTTSAKEMLSSMILMDPQLRRDLDRFMRETARGWQG
jgi:hypothetical protein